MSQTVSVFPQWRRPCGWRLGCWYGYRCGYLSSGRSCWCRVEDIDLGSTIQQRLRDAACNIGSQNCPREDQTSGIPEAKTKFAFRNTNKTSRCALVAGLVAEAFQTHLGVVVDLDVKRS